MTKKPKQEDARAPEAGLAPSAAPARRELLLFCALAVGLVAVVLWRPLVRQEIAFDLVDSLHFEPWKSFPRFAVKHDELLARPYFGTAWSLTDAGWSFYPYFLFVAKELGRGVMPLWSPFAGCGAPFLANQLSAIFDPFQIPFYLLHSPWFYNLDPFLRLFFAGFFAFLFARRVGCPGPSAYFAGAFAMLAPSLYQLWSVPSHARAIAFLPALLWVTEKYVQERSGRALLDLSALVALSVFFGGPEISIATFLQAGLYLLVRLYQDRATPGAEKAGLAARYIGASAFAALPAAIHLLPAVEFFRLSTLSVERMGHRWKDLPIFTRPIAPDDLLPLCAALVAGAAAWKAGGWLRRRGQSASAGKTAGASGVLLVGLALSLLLFLALGMDETFVKMLLPAPHPPVRYGAEIPLGGIFVVALALFALLDADLPPALLALSPGWFLAFAWSKRVPGFSHLLAAIPGLSLGYSFYHGYALSLIFVFWSAWGIERLRRLRSCPWPWRLRSAVLFSTLAFLLAAAIGGAFYWHNTLSIRLVGKLDVGLAPPVLRDGRGSPLMGFMGIGRQERLFQINPVIGWYRKGLPLSDFKVGVLDGAFGTPKQLSVGERVYFMYMAIGPATPVARFRLPDGPHEIQGPRFEVSPIQLEDLKIAGALLPVAVAAIAAALLIPGAAWLAFVAGAGAVCELLLMTVFYVPSIPRDQIFPKNPVTELLAQDRSRFRVYSSEPGFAYLPPISGSVFGLEDFRSDINVASQRAEAFRALAEDHLSSSAGPARAAAYSLLDLANVKYHLAAAAAALPRDRFELAFKARGFKLRRSSRAPQRSSPFEDAFTRRYGAGKGFLSVPRFDSEVEVGDFALWRSKRVSPRAMVFEDAVTIPIPEVEGSAPALERALAIRAWIDARPADFTRTLVLHDDSLRWAAPPGSGRPAPPREARILSYEPSRVEIEADAPRGGYLFLSDTYFPGWKATVDGQASPIAPAWLAFRAVGLKPGSHRVVFEYKPRSFRIGLLLSVIGWGAWLLFFYRLAIRSSRGFLAAAGEWVIEGIVLADMAYWLAWTARHFLAR